MSAFYKTLATEKPISEEDCIATIHASIDAGCNFLDTSKNLSFFLSPSYYVIIFFPATALLLFDLLLISLHLTIFLFFLL